MKTIELFQHHSVAIATLVRSVLYLAIAFGVQLTPEQQVSILGVTESLLAVFVKQTTVSNQRVDTIVEKKTEQRMQDLMTPVPTPAASEVAVAPASKTRPSQA